MEPEASRMISRFFVGFFARWRPFTTWMLKAFLRAARPRTFEQVLALVGAALELFTPEECRNYIRHCGYRLAVQL